MRTWLFILPFFALLVGAVATAVGSSFPQADWLTSLGWVTAAALCGLWVILDLESFKRFFARKGTKYGASSGLTVVLGVVAIVGVAVITSKPRFNKSYDVTRDKLNTLSDQSIKVLDKIKDSGQSLTITTFFTDEQVAQTFRDLIALYLARGADIKVENIDPQIDPTRAMAEKITSANTVIFRYGEQEQRVTTFNEEKLTNAIVNVLKERSKKIYFTRGHGEGQLEGSEATGFSAIVEQLKSNKYDVADLSLLEEAKVPDDADMIVIAGPKYDFKAEEIRFLEEYLKAGGAALVMVDALTQVPALNGFLGDFGIKFSDDLLILSPDDVRAQLIGQNNAIISEFDDFNPVTKDFARQSAVALVLKNTRSLAEAPDNPNDMKVELVGKTSDMIVKVKDVKTEDDLKGLTEDRWETGSYPVLAVASGKAKAPATAQANSEKNSDVKSDAGTTEASEPGKEIRLVVSGSVQFANNAGAQAAEHRDMFMNMASFLLQDEDFISIRPKDPTKSTINLTSSGSQLLLLLLAFIYPCVFLGTGTVYWFKRRRA